MSSPEAPFVRRLLEAQPLLSTLMPARRRWQPDLAGLAPAGRDHLALTFDDGPDPRSTPEFLHLLDRHGIRATFFLLGAWVGPHRSLVEEMSAAGHEVAVHGWNHRATVTLSGRTLRDDLARTADVLRDTTEQAVRWYRPPYGVLNRSARDAAAAADLTPMLWSAWGRDWERGATPARVRRTVARRAAAGGTVLLHDTDRTSAPGSWRVTLAATEHLLTQWQEDGLRVGPLAEHWPDGTAPTPGTDAPAGQADPRGVVRS